MNYCLSQLIGRRVPAFRIKASITPEKSFYRFPRQGSCCTELFDECPSRAFAESPDITVLIKSVHIVRFVDAAWRYSHKWSFLRVIILNGNITRLWIMTMNTFRTIQPAQPPFWLYLHAASFNPQPGTRLPDDHHEEYRQAEYFRTDIFIEYTAK